MDIEKRREFLYNTVMEALEAEPCTLTISSPKIKSARIVFVAKEPIENPTALKELTQEEILEALVLPGAGDEADEAATAQDAAKQNISEYQNQLAHRKADKKVPAYEDEYNEEDLSAKEKHKLEKIKEKEAKREEKALKKMRKDVKKRGFETGVLYELNDPADIYTMTDEEITQIEFASVINEDGFYNFKYPDDHEDIKKDARGRKKTTYVILGFSAVVIILLVIIVNNVLALF